MKTEAFVHMPFSYSEVRQESSSPRTICPFAKCIKAQKGQDTHEAYITSAGISCISHIIYGIANRKTIHGQEYGYGREKRNRSAVT